MLLIGMPSDYEIAASKVLAALGVLRGSGKNLSHPKPVKRLGLPTGDKRNNMIPKVVLKDIGDVLCRMSPKLFAPPQAGTQHVRKKFNKGCPQQQVNGTPFLGFPDIKNVKTSRARFHVNTNILADSLDILNIQQTTNMNTPLSCETCGITFSTIQHCKYHQSVCAAPLPADLSRLSNVQDGGLWLCPWCPVVCPQMNFLMEHKSVCREKGRCNISLASSSQRNQKKRNTNPKNSHKVLSGQNGCSESVRNSDILHRSGDSSGDDENTIMVMDFGENSTLVMDLGEGTTPVTELDKNTTPVIDLDESTTPSTESDKNMTAVIDLDESTAPVIDLDENSIPVIELEP